ncbi:MAG: hypothetical protein IT303_20435 [Dehalococcoidia bacterium]|nr:hypothetical protein [Dehalococcoidia bacterium]
MMQRWTRLAMAVAALAMLAAGVATMVVGQSGQPAKAQITHAGNTIEILPGELGFNPEVCVLNRNDEEVRFYNTDTVARRIVVPEPFDPTPEEPDYRLDTGWIEPGAYSSSAWVVTANMDVEYEDFDNPELTGKIEAPLSPGAATNCKPAPPTPTPTNTPVPTPTPTPTQYPSACDRFFANSRGCAVAPQVSQDEE